MAKILTTAFFIGQFLEFAVTDLVSDGRGLGRHEGMVVLVEDALPGQRVRARVTAVRKSLVEAELDAVLERSFDEQQPPCPHAGCCGGCSWQSLDYQRQLVWKERIVRDALERVGKVQEPPVLPILNSPLAWGYRNKMEFAFGAAENGTRVLGLRKRDSRTIVEVTGCLLQTPLTMRVVSAVRKLVDGAALSPRFLVVREPGAGGCFVELIVGPGSDMAIGERFATALRSVVPEVSGFVLSERSASSDVAYGEKTLYADGQLVEQVGPVRLMLGHNAFFQVNTPAAALLYAEIARFAALETLEKPVLWDVYSGVGSIGFFLAQRVPGLRVVGIEEMPGAVRWARRNAKSLHFKDYCAESGDARSVLGRLLKLGPKPDVVVVDPPRAGMDARVVQQLVQAAPARLVYVSCNPATLARDVARLSPAFRLEAARPVDLFPQTPHVETVCLLSGLHSPVGCA